VLADRIIACAWTIPAVKSAANVSWSANISSFSAFPNFLESLGCLEQHDLKQHARISTVLAWSPRGAAERAQHGSAPADRPPVCQDQPRLHVRLDHSSIVAELAVAASDSPHRTTVTFVTATARATI
jgi:hypothetical protein